MKKFHYTKLELIEALKSLGLSCGDIVFIHSNIGFFGRPEGALNSNEACKIIYDAFKEVIGEDGTLVVPTFTYSFPKKEIFNVNDLRTDMGVFTDYICSLEKSMRSMDSCYSIVAVGSKADLLTKNITENSFAKDSFFDKFYHMNGKICNLNFDAGSTFVHYVERELNVPYRFDKTFEGESLIDGKLLKSKQTIWVRYVSSDLTIASFEEFDKLAKEKGFYVTKNVGRGFVGLISAYDTFTLIEETIKDRPWFLTKAEFNEIKPELVLES